MKFILSAFSICKWKICKCQMNIAKQNELKIEYEQSVDALACIIFDKIYWYNYTSNLWPAFLMSLR